MPEKSLEEFICQRVEYHYQDTNEDYMIGNPKQLAQSIKAYYLAKLPKEKLPFVSINGKKKNSRFNKGVEQYNQSIAEMRKAIEEG